MNEATKLLLIRIAIVVLPIIVLLGTAVLVSGDGFSFSSSTPVADSTHGSGGCNKPYP